MPSRHLAATLCVIFTGGSSWCRFCCPGLRGEASFRIPNSCTPSLTAFPWSARRSVAGDEPACGTSAILSAPASRIAACALRRDLAAVGMIRQSDRKVNAVCPEIWTARRGSAGCRCLHRASPWPSRRAPNRRFVPWELGRSLGSRAAAVRLSQLQVSVSTCRARTDPVRRSPRSIRPLRGSRRCSRGSDVDRRNQVP